MSVLNRMLSDIGHKYRDGRPLYAVPMKAEHRSELRQELQTQLSVNHNVDTIAASFVVWAADYIQSEFRGGQLTWEFVFSGIGLAENRDLGVDLVQRGLRWWGRKVSVSTAGVHLYLYSLMAEGGLPQALLIRPTLYARVIQGLLSDIEREPTDILEHYEIVHQIAARRVDDLPQTLQTTDIIRLVADLGLALVRLRMEPPSDIPTEHIDKWLDQHKPGWEQSLPLRLSKEIAETLIRPALRAERQALPPSSPIAWRALVKSDSGQWKSVVRLAGNGIIPNGLLPSVPERQRLRFLTTGHSGRVNSIVYSTTPIESGWELRRLSGGSNLLPLDFETPFVLAAYMDGRLVGEVEMVPSIPTPEESPSLWGQEATGGNGEDTTELLALGETAKTRSSRVWLLTDANSKPNAGDGVTLGEAQPCLQGLLWPLVQCPLNNYTFQKPIF